jgi:hypothetical protein
MTCFLNGGQTIPAGDQVSIEIDGVTNPTPAGTYTLTVSTTSDPNTVTSPGYNVVANNQVTGVTAALSNSSPGALATYTVGFTTSSTGALSATANSQITIAFAAGTGFTGLTNRTVTDTTTGVVVGGCFSPSGTTITCYLNGGQTIAAGHSVSIKIDGVTNPTTAGPYTLQVSTTSDPTAVTSGPARPPTTGIPSSVTGKPTVAGTRSVVLTATINPHGLATTMHFEYGEATITRAVTYGSVTREQPVGADFADHTVTATVPGLLPNSTYHVRAVASNTAGKTLGADQMFKTAADPPPPPPVVGKAVNVVPVSGRVLIKPPPGVSLKLLDPRDSLARIAALVKGSGFVPLTEARQIPVGSTLDTSAGVVRLVSASGVKRKTYTGEFQNAIFKVLQARRGRERGLTELRLDDNSLPRGKGYSQCVGKAHDAQATSAPGVRGGIALSSRAIQRLHSKAKGRFRTRGRYSAATVRGTEWDTVDRCDGTLTHVTRGVVVVTDFRRRVSIAVPAGKQYLAKAG